MSNQSTMLDIFIAAVNRCLTTLPASLQNLINQGKIKFIQDSQGYYTFCFVAVDPETYETLTKEAETITKSIYASLKIFCLRFCTESEPLPQEKNLDAIRGYFLLGDTWFYQINNQEHPHCLEIIPGKLLVAGNNVVLQTK